MTDSSSLRARAIAFCEVVGVFCFGMGLSIVFMSAFGLTLDFTVPLHAKPPDFLLAARVFAANVGIRYAGMLIPAGLLTAMRRRTHPVPSRVRLPLARLVGIGLLAAACVVLPMYLLFLTPPGQAMLAPFVAVKWSISFWIFMAVNGVVMMPALEELFFRGYFQSRLAEAFGNSAAIVISSAFFICIHARFQQLKGFDVAMSAVLFLFSLALGYLYARTGSLIPGIIVHGLLNCPPKALVVHIAVIVFTAALVVLFHRRIRTAVVGAARDLARIPGTSFVIACTALCMLFGFLLGVRQHETLYGGAVLMVIAIISQYARGIARPKLAPVTAT
jgi:membrane protease YdiL (CAAX protease family)